MMRRWLLVWLILTGSLAGCVPAHELPSRRQQRVLLFGRVVRRPLYLREAIPRPVASTTPSGHQWGRQLRWWLPRRTRTVEFMACRTKQKEVVTNWRWRLGGQVALLDQAGHPLTPYRFNRLVALTPALLCYDTLPSAASYRAAVASGIFYPSLGLFDVQYALLNRAGRRIGTHDYVWLVPIGPNAVWAMRALRGRMCYGVIDSLAHPIVAFDSVALSLPDAAGLLRRRSAPARSEPYVGASSAQYSPIHQLSAISGPMGNRLFRAASPKPAPSGKVARWCDSDRGTV